MQEKFTLIIHRNENFSLCSEENTNQVPTAQAFCVKFFLANRHHPNGQTNHQSLTLRVAMDLVWSVRQHSEARMQHKVSSGYLVVDS